MDDAPAPLLQVANEAEGDEVCEELRAAGIKCNHARVADPSAPLSFLHVYGEPDTRIVVFVHPSDLERARVVAATRRERGTADDGSAG